MPLWTSIGCSMAPTSPYTTKILYLDLSSSIGSCSVTNAFLNPHPHHSIVISKEFPTGYHRVSTPILKVSNNPWISMQHTSNPFQIICNYCSLIYSYRSDLGRSFSEGPPCKPVKKEPPLIPTWTKYFQQIQPTYF